MTVSVALHVIRVGAQFIAPFMRRSQEGRNELPPYDGLFRCKSGFIPDDTIRVGYKTRLTGKVINDVATIVLKRWLKTIRRGRPTCLPISKISPAVVRGRTHGFAPTMLLLALMFSAIAHADDVFNHPQTAEQLLNGPLSRPAAALRDAQVMRGKFIYKKFLKEIPQPLISRGEFLFARALGIEWHTREPFDSDFVLTAKGMTQRDDGKLTLQMNASEQPAVQVVAHIFLSLLSLDVVSLQNSFTLSGVQQGKPGAETWQVGMRPTAAAIAAVFKEAVVSGGAQVETLVLRDANGDRTEISFSDVHYAPTITAAERAVLVNGAARKP